MITKICQGCNETYEHDDPHPVLAQAYEEMTLYCGHHINHVGWRHVELGEWVWVKNSMTQEEAMAQEEEEARAQEGNDAMAAVERAAALEKGSGQQAES